MRSWLVRSSVFLSLVGSGAAFGWYDYHAAIAWSPSTNAYGWATNMASPWHAAQAAVTNCGRWDCRVAVNVTNGCAALSVGAGGGFGWAIGVDRWYVANAAVANCSASTYGCGVLAWACTSGF